MRRPTPRPPSPPLTASTRSRLPSRWPRRACCRYAWGGPERPLPPAPPAPHPSLLQVLGERLAQRRSELPLPELARLTALLASRDTARLTQASAAALGLPDERALMLASRYVPDTAALLAGGGDDDEDSAGGGEGSGASIAAQAAKRWRYGASQRLAVPPFARVARSLADRASALTALPTYARSAPYMVDDSDDEWGGAAAHSSGDGGSDAGAAARRLDLRLSSRLDVIAALAQLATDAISVAPPASMGPPSVTVHPHAAALLGALEACVRAEALHRGKRDRRPLSRREGGVTATQAIGAALRPLLLLSARGASESKPAGEYDLTKLLDAWNALQEQQKKFAAGDQG